MSFNIYDYVDSLLEPLGVPCAAIRYIDPPSTYITYIRYAETAEAVSDDVVKAETYFIQIDIWSNKAPFATAEKVKDKLIQNGFIKRSVLTTYEDDTQLFREGMRFSYTPKF